MYITWHGQTCFKILTQKERNNSVNILIDPFDKEAGLRFPKLESDIVLVSRDIKDSIKGNYFLIQGPGEYDIKGVYIEGFQALTKSKEDSSQKTIIYTIEAEEIRICHLGILGQNELTSEQLEKIGDVDVLLIPVGGGGAINASQALKIMSQIEPKITVPMYYQIPKLKVKLEGLDKFLKNLGIKSLEPISKLSIKKKDLSEEEAKIIVLNP